MAYKNIFGRNIYYEIKGEGQPLVFLHCWTGNHKFFDKQVNYFSKKNYQCITVDFPGHGNSEGIKEYNPEIFSTYTYRLILELGLKDIILIGHSLGGMVSLQLCLQHPKLVKALILTDTSSNLNAQILQRVSASFGSIFGIFAPAIAKKAVIDFAGVHPLCSFEVRDFIKREVIKIPNIIVVKLLRGIKNFNVTEKLKEIKIPVQILVGDFDLLTDIRHAITLAKNIKNSKLKIIKFAGHMAPQEQPDEFNKCIEEFLRNI